MAPYFGLTGGSGFLPELACLMLIESRMADFLDIGGMQY